MTWTAWNTLAELTDALLVLSYVPSDIQGDVMLTIARFVILL